MVRTQCVKKTAKISIELGLAIIPLQVTAEGYRRHPGAIEIAFLNNHCSQIKIV
jgi:hypothetical protein